MRPALISAAAAALLALAAPARPATGLTIRYPSGDAPDAATLAAVLRSPDVSTVIFERGTNPFSSTLTVFRREGLTLQGATGRSTDTILQSSASVALLLEESRGITIRNLTIRTSVAAGEAVRLQSVQTSSIEGFVRDVTVRNCRLEGFVGIRGTVRAQALDVADCRFDVTKAGGAGILWEDGPELFVTRSRFVSSSGSTATGAIVVRGASVAESEGDRARRVHLTANRADGDFESGFFLADVVDALVQRNRIRFSTSVSATGRGRAGVVVQRGAASAPTEDWLVRSNRIEGAHTGVWLLNANTTSDLAGGAIAGKVEANDLRRSGASDTDTRFNDTGAAVRVDLFGPNCKMLIAGNDLRRLRSPSAKPAILVSPAGGADACLGAASGNRVDPGRDEIGEGVAKR